MNNELRDVTPPPGLPQKQRYAKHTINQTERKKICYHYIQNIAHYNKIKKKNSVLIAMMIYEN